MDGLTAYKCPSCGANLLVAPQQTYVKCNFCGTSFQRELDSSEQDSLNAQMLADKLTAYKNDLRRYKSLRDSVDFASGKAETQKKTSSAPMVNLATLLFGLAFFVILACIGFLIFDSTLARGIIVFLLITWSIGIIVEFADGANDKRKEAKAARQANIDEKSYELAKKKFDEFAATFNENLVPEQYRNDQALDYVIELFRYEQVSSLGEAFRHYDEQLHYAKMEAMQQQQLQLQKQQLARMSGKDHRI